MTYFVYILRCSDKSLYCGVTNNLKRREKEHNTSKSKASRYTRLRRPVKLVYTEKFQTLQQAMRKERQIKKWSRAKKEALIKKDLKFLKTSLSDNININ